MINKYAVIRYLLDEAEAKEKEVQKRIANGETKWWARYGTTQLIKDNMKKIRQLSLFISKELNNK